MTSKNKRITFAEAAKNDAQRTKRRIEGEDNSAFRSLGFMGMVGWSVAVPLVLCTAGGVWLDRHVPMSFSWTLSLMAGGLVLGCTIAWHWVDTTRKG